MSFLQQASTPRLAVFGTVQTRPVSIPGALGLVWINTTHFSLWGHQDEQPWGY
jgi:hypothetical protein